MSNYRHRETRSKLARRVQTWAKKSKVPRCPVADMFFGDSRGWWQSFYSHA